MDAKALAKELKLWTLQTKTEGLMQSDIEQVFRTQEIQYKREHFLGVGKIIDFMVGDVGVECKKAGSVTEVLAQLSKYAECEPVKELLLVTTKASHRRIDGQTLQGKPVTVHVIVRV